MSRELASGMVHLTNAAAVWKDLGERIAKRDLTRIYQVHHEICTITQGNLSISEFFSRLKTAWENYSALLPVPQCCDKSKVYAEHMKQQRLMQFFMGLNETYSHARSQILMIVLAPTLNQAYSMLLRDESQRVQSNLISQTQHHIEQVNLNNTTALAVAHYDKFKKATNSEMYCTHCHRKGHIMEKCYRLVGYPTGHKLYKAKPEERDAKPRFYANKRPAAHNVNYNGYVDAMNRGYQHQFGYQHQSVPHVVNGSEGCSYGQIPARAHHVGYRHDNSNYGNPQNMGPTGSYSGHSHGRNLYGMPSANHIYGHGYPQATQPHGPGPLQYQQMQQILDKDPKLTEATANIATSASKSWVVDTGATNHMGSSLDFLDHPQAVLRSSSNTTHLPNSTSTNVSHTGTSIISDFLKLDNDLCTGKVREIGKVKGSLYILDPATSLSHTMAYKQAFASSVFTSTYTSSPPPLQRPSSPTTTSQTWHQRLGHAPITVLQKIPSLKLSVSNKDTPLFVFCPLSKQTRFPFPHSVKKIVSPFQVVHMDVWGPYRQYTYNGYRYFLTIVDDYTRMTWVFLMKHKSDSVIHI
ncbi:uncharacterized protein LOC132601727 [Lycium barbarum]|uniref:uncharacterized protein LOC132601727 n=1 Tax=Lycium barbarum TaxID=112863 RepID=UPI00293F0436|nr:uncharacterized protein LOC132601727 [Lycium barbarum]